MKMILFLLFTVSSVLSWEESPQQQAASMQFPSWYAPRSQQSSSSSLFPSASAPPGRTAYPPNFPGYPTFGPPNTVGKTKETQSSGHYSTTTNRPRKSSPSIPSKTKTKSNVDKYLPLMAKKNKKEKEVTDTTEKMERTKKTRRPRVKTTTETPEEERETIVVIEYTSSSTTTKTPSTSPTSTKKMKKNRRKGRPSRGPKSTTTTSTTEKPAESLLQFNILDYLWTNSELIAAIKDVVKKLQSSINEAGLKEDVQQVSNHFKNTIKEFAAASPVNQQLRGLFERAQHN